MVEGGSLRRGRNKPKREGKERMAHAERENRRRSESRQGRARTANNGVATQMVVVAVRSMVMVRKKGARSRKRDIMIEREKNREMRKLERAQEGRKGRA